MTADLNILEKIKQAGLVGRGGASFPTHKKWERIQVIESDIKYVVCNASEGELAVSKDYYILTHYPELVIKGLILAMDFLNSKEAYFNFNSEYYQDIQEKFEPLLNKYREQGYKLFIFQENPSYIGGETGALLNAIEGKRVEPRLKPPSPSVKGLHGKPTLVQNVETLYNVALVAADKFKNTRFYTISGPVANPGVYELAADWPSAKVLRETNNYPESDFFIQIGGSASGPVISKEQAEEQPVEGTGAIEIYPTDIPSRDLLMRWFGFYSQESCGKCTPCREGTYQLFNLVEDNKEIPWSKILEIIHTLKLTSFCALGESVAIPIESYLKNILGKKQADLLALLEKNYDSRK
ncbi:MAG: NADH-ubiquinone oxidoreductase-F iron-sulfur binding region domain-containing protein [Candidatus Woesebacteria bacterium]|jgi:NADH:ubiquinone oxidoreductase subunit F (NADH-binding)